MAGVVCKPPLPHCLFVFPFLWLNTMPYLGHMIAQVDDMQHHVRQKDSSCLGLHGLHGRGCMHLPGATTGIECGLGIK